MDDVDKALEALKVQIKKEIVDNYFAGRVELEEEVQDFREEVAAYQAEYGTLPTISWPFTRPWGQRPPSAEWRSYGGWRSPHFIRTFTPLPSRRGSACWRAGPAGA